MIIKRITKTITTMKQIYITLIALIFSATLFAQGIAVQGIARDNNKAALPQKDLNFTFRIISKDGDERYTESQPIRTDNFGVFSHIVGTGTKLNGVAFSEQGLKIEVSILNSRLKKCVLFSRFIHSLYS